MKRSPYCMTGPKIFKERMKFELCKRVDDFFNETTTQSATTKDWMREYFTWSQLKMLNKEQEKIYG